MPLIKTKILKLLYIEGKKSISELNSRTNDLQRVLSKCQGFILIARELENA